MSSKSFGTKSKTEFQIAVVCFLEYFTTKFWIRKMLAENNIINIQPAKL